MGPCVCVCVEKKVGKIEGGGGGGEEKKTHQWNQTVRFKIKRQRSK